MSAREAILAAGFVPPFKVCPDLDWVVDSNPQRGMQAATHEDQCDGALIPRGWGRIGYMPDAEAVFDAWAAAFYEVVGHDECDAAEVVRKLNEACELGEEVGDD